MQRESNALSKLLERLKLATNPATGFFLVALFIYGFIGSYFGDVRSEAHPQYAASPDVKTHSSKRAIVFVYNGLDHVPALSTQRGLLEAVNAPHVSWPPLARSAQGAVMP
jgi:hypothetical protein